MNTTLTRSLCALAFVLCFSGPALHAQETTATDAVQAEPLESATAELESATAGLRSATSGLEDATAELRSATSGLGPATSELDRIVESGTIRVGVNPNYKPFSFLDEKQMRIGVDIDIAHRLATALGVELELTAPETFGELIPMLVDDSIDIVVAGMSITFDRAMMVNFTQPYFDTGLSVMMNIGSSARLGIAGSKDSASLVSALAGKSGARIAVTEGKAPALEAERRFPDATITGYPTNEEAAQATAEGRADLMIHDEIFLKLWLEQSKGPAKNRLAVLDPPIKPDFYGIAARKGDADWLRLLDLFVSELRTERAVVGYLGAYLPSMSMTEMSGSVIPLFELRDME